MTTEKIHTQLVTFAAKLRTVADVTAAICDCLISRFGAPAVNLGKQIEAKIEAAEREPDDAKRSAIHQSALADEKKLAAQTPEPAKEAATDTNEVTAENWPQVMCSAGTAKLCFGQSMGALAGHGVKLATAQRHVEYLTKWFEKKPAITDDDKRTLSALRFAIAATKARETTNPAPESTPASPEAPKQSDAPELPLEGAGEPAVEESKSSSTFNWRLVPIPFEIKMGGQPMLGVQLGKLEPPFLKVLQRDICLKDHPKYPVKTTAEKTFKAAMAMACDELKIVI